MESLGIVVCSFFVVDSMLNLMLIVITHRFMTSAIVDPVIVRLVVGDFYTLIPMV